MYLFYFGARVLCSADRCMTKMKAIPVLGGRYWSRSEKASSPPADAPIPTMGKDGVGCVFSTIKKTSVTNVKI